MCGSNRRSVSGRQAMGRALETGKQGLSITTAPALALKHIDKGTALRCSGTSVLNSWSRIQGDRDP